MNYLAHLHLGGHGADQLLGSLYGDFVKGHLEQRFAPDVRAGIILHRRIDAFTDAHPRVHTALARFSDTRRRYAGIVVDVFFDHCLARDWQQYSEESLSSFSQRAYQALANEPQLPPRLAAIAPSLIADDWLGAYAHFGNLAGVMRGISRRLSQPQALQSAYAELQQLYEPLSEDFRRFYPLLQDFAIDQRLQLDAAPAT